MACPAGGVADVTPLLWAFALKNQSPLEKRGCVPASCSKASSCLTATLSETQLSGVPPEEAGSPGRKEDGGLPGGTPCAPTTVGLMQSSCGWAGAALGGGNAANPPHL